MPPRGLPGNANLEQLRNSAKGLQRAVRAGDPGAAAIVNEFHPRLGTATPGSPELDAFTRADGHMDIVSMLVDAGASWERCVRSRRRSRRCRSERFEDLAEMVSPDVDWRGIREPDGGVPRCVGREEAMERMRVGPLAGGQVSVSAFVEDGDRVLAHVHHVDEDRERGTGRSSSTRSLTLAERRCPRDDPRARNGRREARNVVGIGRDHNRCVEGCADCDDMSIRDRVTASAGVVQHGADKLGEPNVGRCDEDPLSATIACDRRLDALRARHASARLSQCHRRAAHLAATPDRLPQQVTQRRAAGTIE